ncbi:MAG: hypothetical protein Q9182_002540 [Xanthomendoza sp. 2 TL-2023]
MDVSRGRKATTRFTTQLDVLGSRAGSEDSRCTALLALSNILRSPIEANNLRIVKWYINKSELDVQLVNVIGLELRLQAAFLSALSRKLNNPTRCPHCDPGESRFSYPEHHIIGSTVATFIQNGISNPPTVLIAHIYDFMGFGVNNDLRVLELLDIEAQRTSPNDTLEASEPSAWGTLFERYKCCSRDFTHYRNYISNWLEHEPEASNDQQLFYISLCPLFIFASVDLQVDYGRILDQLSVLREENIEMDSGSSNESRGHRQTYSILERRRCDLRRSYEDLDSSQQTLKSYIASNGDTDCLSGKSYHIAMAEVDRTICFARRLEAEVRDYLQFVVGSLSIAESRKSIELSARQIREGQKGSLSTRRCDENADFASQHL